MRYLEDDDIRKLAGDFEEGASLGRLKTTYGLDNQWLLKNLVAGKRRGLIRPRSFQRLVISEEEERFPNDSEMQLDAVFGSVNGELKCATLLFLDSEPKTARDLKKELLEAGNIELPEDATFKAYCLESFYPAGLVKAQLVGKGTGLSVAYFSLTRAGEYYGQPIAAFSLEYAVDNGISLETFLGPTHSTGKPCPAYIRAEIMRLLESGTGTVAELERQLVSSKQNVVGHLKNLEKLGFIYFRSLDTEFPGIKKYKWVKGKSPEDAKAVSGWKTLATEVARWMCKNRTGDRNIIGAELGYGVRRISTVLTGLQRQGLVEADFDGYQRSDIGITGKSAVLDRYVKAVRAALSEREKLEEMEDVLNSFRGNRKRFRKYLEAGIELYREASPVLNASTQEKRVREVAAFIEEYRKREQKGPRPAEIARGLEWNRSAVRDSIRYLEDNGLLVSERKGKQKRCMLVASYSGST